MNETCDKCDRVTDVYTDEWSLCRWHAPPPSPEVLQAIHALKGSGLFTIGENR